VVCWVAALIQATLLFLIGQLLVTDSVVATWLANLNPQLQAIANVFMKWLEEHPEVSVQTTQNLLFYFFTTNLLTLSLIAVALAMPHLITRDLSSNAVIIYSSKALSRFDYFLGKFATVFGLLALTWLGPVCAGWFLGNLLAPDWHFFWHSRAAIGHALLYVVTSMVVLSFLGLGISAISAREKATVSFWIVFWLVGNAFIPIGEQTKSWLKHFSFSFNLDQISLAIFRLANDLKVAQDNIPLLGNLLRGIPRETYAIWESPELTGALVGLAVMIVLALVLVISRVKPE
jgi:hypothetical protein